VAGFDLVPTVQQGETVCNLFAEFLSGLPGEFREPIPFLKNLEMEMQWAAAAGGAAFVAFFHGGEPVSLGVLLSGVNIDADDQMRRAFSASVTTPILGDASTQLLDAPERPVLMKLQMPGYPEIAPTLDLLHTALASVYFRAILALAAAEVEPPRV
jgi:hypothetical protein